jgi:hypothetical protein
MFKKILLIGSSTFNPNYFNSRIYGDEITLDNFSFQSILEKIARCEVKSLAINGAGNDWPVNAIFTNQDYIDLDTLVVILWAATDRYDMHFDNSKTNEQLSFPRKDLLPDHVKTEHVFFRTFGLDGTIKDSGIRFYATGPAYPGIKREYQRISYSNSLHLKKCYENIILVQKLLKGKCLKQIHMFPFDIEKYSEIDLLGPKGFFSKIQNNNTYVCADLPEPSFDLIKEYPELKLWKDQVDWSLFVKNYIDYFKENNLPYWAGLNNHNMHQVPLNNYKFITSQIIDSKVDLTDFYKDATIKHCTEFNIKYPNLF